MKFTDHFHDLFCTYLSLFSVKIRMTFDIHNIGTIVSIYENHIIKEQKM